MADQNHLDIPRNNNSACRICSQLGDKQYASQKFGWEESDTHLPLAWNELALVKDLRPSNASRKLQLFQCPHCGTYYLYQTDYDYLVNGTEDEELLMRLKDNEAEEYLEQ